ncbi:MAG: hypothetical protein L0387_10920 [Acidobacteria bacterium]|nr:hypothetical protein [Acidobacteriota bacterium]
MPSTQSAASWIKVWNRKLHFYLGLYLLWFIWLFAVSGLLLNHPKWSFAEFWPNRQEQTLEKSIQVPKGRGDLVEAQDLMGQLDLTGEVQWTTTQATAGRFDFSVVSPGQIIEVQTDLVERLAKVKQIQTNGWGVINMMHTFTGVRKNDDRNNRDWFMTKVWSFSMDAVAIGLLFLVLSSLYMGYQLKQKWVYQAVSLGLGVLSCAFFIWGLSWL